MWLNELNARAHSKSYQRERDEFIYWETETSCLMVSQSNEILC